MRLDHNRGLTLLLAGALAMSGSAVLAATINVGSARPAPNDTFQGAVAAAGAGDTLLLDAETFLVPSTLTINKTLTIIGQGQDQSVIENGFTFTTFTGFIVLTGTNVSFSALTIKAGNGAADASRGYGVMPRASGATFRDVHFDGNYVRSWIVPDSNGNNITVDRSLFTGYVGQEGIRESGADLVITNNRFEEYHYNWGPIRWEESWPLSARVEYNYFASRVGLWDGPDGTGNPLFSGFSLGDGNENQLDIQMSNIAPEGVLIAHNTFVFRDTTRTNIDGLTPLGNGIVIQPVVNGPITVRDNIFTGFEYDQTGPTPTWDTTGGQFGGALAFNGVNSFASFPAPGAGFGSEGTFNVWIKVDAAATTKRNMIMEGPGDGSLEFQYRPNNNGQLYGSPEPSNFDYAIQDGNAAGTVTSWTNVQYTWDFAAKTMHLFVNGTEVTYLDANFDENFPDWTSVIDTATGTMYLGTDPGDSSRTFHGLIDDVALFDRALTSAELDAIRTQNVGAAAADTASNPNLATDLLAYWALDNASGTSAAGDAGTPFALTLAAAAPGQSVALNHPAANVTATNNLFFANDVNAIPTEDAASLTADPLFAGTGTDADELFSLQETSPALGRATDGSSIGAWQPGEVWVAEAPTGDDVAGFGSFSAPYATVQRGVNAVDADGIVHVLRGGYPESVSISKSVTLDGEQGAGSAVITGAGVGLDVAAGVASVMVNDLTIDGHTTGIKTASGSTELTLTRAAVTGNNIGVSIENGTDFVASNTFFGSNTTAHVEAAGQFARLDVQGNEFAGANVYTAATVDGAPFLSPAPVIDNNWFADEYTPDTADSTPGNGYIDGMVKTVSAAGSDQAVSSSLIVAQLDRDVDGLSDAYELAGGVTAFNNFSSPGSGGLPDGVDSLGFVITTDTDGDGYPDWFELARRSDPTDSASIPALGDVVTTGSITLSDAVRALQIINGAFPLDLASGDVNALNVTGNGPNSLSNALQILRFQAGVRQYLPAKPGLN